MHSLKRLTTRKSQLPSLLTFFPTNIRSKSTNNGEEEWNDAWESAWLPDNLSSKNRAPWELDVNFPSSSTVLLPSDVDTETKAFVEDITENWNERKGRSTKTSMKEEEELKKKKESLYSVENMKKDYRTRKQRIHAGLWMKEIEKQEEAKLGGGGGDDIERLLDSCSEIFETSNNDSKVPTTSEFKTKPDGWETTSKSQDGGNAWEISQREEDILLQEFERRIAYSKFQVKHWQGKEDAYLEVRAEVTAAGVVAAVTVETVEEKKAVVLWEEAIIRRKAACTPSSQQIFSIESSLASFRHDSKLYQVSHI